MRKFIFGAVLALLATPAYAADTAADTITSVGTPLLAVVVPLIIAAFKRALPSIPGWAIPLLAPALGAAGDVLLSLLMHVPVTGWKGALAGLAGVGVREVVDQAKKALPS